MFCGKCGQFVNDSDKFCKNCGEAVTPINSTNYINNNPVNNNYSNQNYNDNNFQSRIVVEKEDKVNVFLVILSILLPIVGLILFLALKSETPKKAKAAGIAALISFIVGFVLSSILVSAVVVSAMENFDYLYEDFDYDSTDFEELYDEDFNNFYNNKGTI